jgi:hypothetical protein
MYEPKSIFDNTEFIIQFVLELIILIVFLRMAWNVGVIRKNLTRKNSNYYFEESLKLEFIGKNNKAKDALMKRIYLIENEDYEYSEKIKIINNSINKIKELGFELPDTLKKYQNPKT